MGFVDGLGRAASTLVQRYYLAAPSLREVVTARSRHCERSEAISILLRRFAPRSDERLLCRFAPRSDERLLRRFAPRSDTLLMYINK